jgi:hypothetical protein
MESKHGRTCGTRFLVATITDGRTAYRQSFKRRAAERMPVFCAFSRIMETARPIEKVDCRCDGQGDSDRSGNTKEVGKEYRQTSF